VRGVVVVYCALLSAVVVVALLFDVLLLKIKIMAVSLSIQINSDYDMKILKDSLDLVSRPSGRGRASRV